MTFRTRLLLSFTVTVVATVAAATWVASLTARRAFEQQDSQRTAALVAQFRREFTRRGEEIVRRVEGLAASDRVLRLAVEASQPQPDYSPYLNEASALAGAQNLEFLELISGDGTILSSAHWPARFLYKAAWVTEPVDWKSQGAFLRTEEWPAETALVLVAVRAVDLAGNRLYVVAGQRLDRDFLASLTLPAGMRVLLYCNDALIDDGGPVREPRRFTPLIEQGREATAWVETAAGPEIVQAIPLLGREGSRLGTLLVASSRRELLSMVHRIRWFGVLAGGLGVLVGVLLSLWVSRRFTHPVEALAQGARQVAGGDWDTSVPVLSRDELGQLAESFNLMTRQLLDQRERLVQSERVAAWRELARRLAHELKNPLFPLQITVENLQRAKAQAPEMFDEVFSESTATLLSELSNLKSIVARFSDFAKMPAPQMETVDLNELVRKAVHLFEAQATQPGRMPVSLETECAENLGSLDADPDQLGRALNNLLLNALDAMPAGGVIRIRTARRDGRVLLEVSDTGQGLTQEECSRLFTPYYTTKRHGTGLGLAIVQSVVSDHHGKIGVESEPGKGTTFRIEL